MTMYTVKTHKSEADAILKGDKMFIIRADEPRYKIGSNITFIVADDKRITKHPIEDNVYRISFIDRGYPIEDGMLLIGFRSR